MLTAALFYLILGYQYVLHLSGYLLIPPSLLRDSMSRPRCRFKLNSGSSGIQNAGTLERFLLVGPEGPNEYKRLPPYLSAPDYEVSTDNKDLSLVRHPARQLPSFRESVCMRNGFEGAETGRRLGQTSRSIAKCRRGALSQALEAWLVEGSERQTLST